MKEETRYLIEIKTYITSGSESLLIKTDEYETNGNNIYHTPNKKFLGEDNNYTFIIEVIKKRIYSKSSNGNYLELIEEIDIK